LLARLKTAPVLFGEAMFYLPLLYVTGLFTLLLGIAHFFFPALLDFRTAIPVEGAALRPFRLLFIRYTTQRSDVHGIAWVMNHAASYTLVTVGLLDLLWRCWIDSPLRMIVCVWIAGWWVLRAGSQLYLGQRRGDWLIISGFASFALLHLLIAYVP
jgi:hypothetical protein